MEQNKDSRMDGTMEQDIIGEDLYEDLDEDEDESGRDITISLASIIQEVITENVYETESARNYNRVFEKNLNLLVGGDFAQYLKDEYGHYKIPKGSKTFVKRLLIPDEELKKVMKKKDFNVKKEVLEDVDAKKVEAFVSNDVTMDIIRFEVYKLFGRCQKDKRDAVMRAFYVRNNPYYDKVKEGLVRVQALLDEISVSPHMDLTTCRALYEDVERCVQDIRFFQKRANYIYMFEPEVIKMINRLMYYTESQ